MKKVLFAALMTIAVQGVFAQVNKGQWLVGGNVSFESTKQGDAKSTSFTFSPKGGYFFADKFAGGLRVDFESTKPKGADAATDLLIAPFVRYYFLPAADKVNIFADGSYGFGSSKRLGNSESLNAFAFSAGPAIFLSPNTALEFALQYRSLGGDAIGDDRANNFGVNIGFQIHLGGGAKK
ncbi:MAG: porin family protein [Niastella sp.]|nr:porin family protein [Niastella sp.]